jgi:uncharacterized membrane protein
MLVYDMDEYLEIPAFVVCFVVLLCLLMSCMDWVDGVQHGRQIARAPPLYWHLPRRL